MTIIRQHVKLMFYIFIAEYRQSNKICIYYLSFKSIHAIKQRGAWLIDACRRACPLRVEGSRTAASQIRTWRLSYSIKRWTWETIIMTQVVDDLCVFYSVIKTWVAAVTWLPPLSLLLVCLTVPSQNSLWPRCTIHVPSLNFSGVITIIIIIQ